MIFKSEKKKIVSPDKALVGRNTQMSITGMHVITGEKMTPPFPENSKCAVFALGCFWGAERKFWSLPGVYSTAAGYTAGCTPNPTYEEVCSGSTGHTEAVLVVFNPQVLSYSDLLKVFWESHNPTQGMQQGNDVGTQYRSGIYGYDEEQISLAQSSKSTFQSALDQQDIGAITTEITTISDFYYAEEYHQQYLAKNPNGYCGLGGCGINFDKNLKET